MFGKKTTDNIEFNRRHMIAVRLVDALNFVAPKTILGFKPILLGFRLKITQERAEGWHSNDSPKFHIEPAGWPKGNFIEGFLNSQDGFMVISHGVIVSPWGEFTLHGTDMGTEMSYQPRESQMLIMIHPKR